IASIFCSRVIPAIKKAPPNVRVVSNIWGADQFKESALLLRVAIQFKPFDILYKLFINNNCYLYKPIHPHHNPNEESPSKLS
ncbi:hypothetical protein, partial [Lysinibacillus fusiformis]|uniref:hypothetical protein n=1 Tax=Lysinibacillus fusiformis TaxID=28031 RepID=UPI003D06035C